MEMPSSLKDLQTLCIKHNLKYKGKTKAELTESLKSVDGDLYILEEYKDNFQTNNIKKLRTFCSEKGLSKTGSKCELIRRLRESNKSNSNIQVLKWADRRRKKVNSKKSTNPNSQVKSTVTKTIYSNFTKEDLKKECLKRCLPTYGRGQG